MDEVQKETYETVERIMDSPMGMVSIATMAHNLSQGGQIMEREAAAIIVQRFMEGVIKLTIADIKGLRWEDVTDDEAEHRRFEAAQIQMGEHSTMSRFGSEEEHRTAADAMQKAFDELRWKE